MEGLATITLLALALYLLYATGIMKLVTSSLEKATRMADNKMEYLEMSQAEKLSRDYGKLDNKLGDGNIPRSSAKSVSAKLKAL